MRCLDDTTVFRLVQGQLSAADLAVADQHLDGCRTCRVLVAASARGLDERKNPGEESLFANAESRPTSIDRFVILDVLGGGAMGVVYAAYDPKLDRRVALKVLLPGDPSDDGQRRLLREAQAMAKLSHPNVVTVYEVGEVDARVFLAMELITGDTLRAWARAAPRDWRAIRDVMAQAGEGLAAAHAEGIVHRDVKPDNVIVGADGRAKVGDFGLARSLSPEVMQPGSTQREPTQPRSTTSRAFAGTPAYMPPEQLRAEAVDARADQFAFCVTFWELLHGERPFAGATTGALLDAIAKGAPPGAKRVPGWLDAALRRGLSARPDDRFSSMTDLLQALTRDRRQRSRGAALGAFVLAAVLTIAIAMRPSRAVPTCDGGRDRIRAVWGDDARARVRAAFAATGVPYATGAAEGVVTNLDAWAARWAGAHDDTCRATRVRGEQSELLLDLRMRCLDRQRADLAALVDRLAIADAAVVARASDATSALGSTDECAITEALSAVDPAPSAPEAAAKLSALARRLGEARAEIAVGHPARAVALGAPLIAEAQAIGHRPTIAEASLTLAEAERMAGSHADADAAAFEALWAAQAGHDDLGVARAWITLVGVAGERRDHATAAHRGRHAAAAITRLGEPPLLAAKLANATGLIALNLGHLDAAGPPLERALLLRRKLFGEMDPEVARSHSALGNLARLRGDLAAAEDHHRRALAIDRAVLGASHPDVGRDLHNLAGVLRLGERLDDAEATYREALAIKRASLGDRHVEVGLTENSLGLVALQRGRLDDAEARFSTALAILAAAGHPDRALSLQNLGLCAARRGDPRAALSSFAEALPLYVADLGASHERVARLRFSIAEAHLALGQNAEAIAEAKRVAEIARAAPHAADLAAAADALLATSATSPAPSAARVRRIDGAYGASQAWDRP